MIQKKVLCSNRVRGINGSFGYLEHRFLRDGFWETLSHDALVLYVFLILVGDRKGLSYYPCDKICNLLKITVDDYIAARNDLIQKDLVAFLTVVFFRSCHCPQPRSSKNCGPSQRPMR